MLKFEERFSGDESSWPPVVQEDATGAPLPAVDVGPAARSATVGAGSEGAGERVHVVPLPSAAGS